MGTSNYNNISKIVVSLYHTLYTFPPIQMAYYNNLQTKIVSNYWRNINPLFALPIYISNTLVYCFRLEEVKLHFVIYNYCNR